MLEATKLGYSLVFVFGVDDALQSEGAPLLDEASGVMQVAFSCFLLKLQPLLLSALS